MVYYEHGTDDNGNPTSAQRHLNIAEKNSIFMLLDIHRASLASGKPVSLRQYSTLNHQMMLNFESSEAYTGAMAESSNGRPNFAKYYRQQVTNGPPSMSLTSPSSHASTPSHSISSAVETFKRGIKRDASAYPVLKDE